MKKNPMKAAVACATAFYLGAGVLSAQTVLDRTDALSLLFLRRRK